MRVYNRDYMDTTTSVQPPLPAEC